METKRTTIILPTVHLINKEYKMSDHKNNDLSLLLENFMKNKELITKYEKFAGKLLFSITKGEYARPFTSSDILSNIICKLLTNKYNWNSEKASFDAFMHARIKSEIINITKHERKFIPVPTEILEDDSNENDDDDCKTKMMDELVQEPDFMFPDEDNDEDVGTAELEEIIYSLFREAPVDFCVADELFKNKSPKDIASALGISVNEVRSTVMRIRRKLITWCKRNNHRPLLNKFLRPVKKNNRNNNHLGLDKKYFNGGIK